MNIKHIQYLVEIERVRSISQAAENLYIGQPNLSRILKEIEADVGFQIFLRTTNGVRPTERGATFLQHARNILREMEAIQSMSPYQKVDDRLRICIPRSSAAFQLVSDCLRIHGENRNLNAEIRECHAKKALELLSDGHAEIGIIRFRDGYEEYFQEVAASAKLTFKMLSSYDDVIIMHQNHPLAKNETIKIEELNQWTEIVHGDHYIMSQSTEDKGRSQIYTVDRQAQLTLLTSIFGSFMWSAPQNEKQLQQYGLVQKHCSGYAKGYREALIYNHQHAMNTLESALLETIFSHYGLHN